jgi:hypothetical protein
MPSGIWWKLGFNSAVFLTGKQENVEQENVKTWARGGLELVFLTGKSWK